MRYGRPVKRSVTIAGHETSVSLEPMFWAALERSAAARGTALNALIGAIDAERITARPTPNLTSAIRQWLLANALAPGGPPHGRDEGGAAVGCVLEP